MLYSYSFYCNDNTPKQNKNKIKQTKLLEEERVPFSLQFQGHTPFLRDIRADTPGRNRRQKLKWSHGEMLLTDLLLMACPVFVLTHSGTTCPEGTTYRGLGPPTLIINRMFLILFMLNRSH